VEDGAFVSHGLLLPGVHNLHIQSLSLWFGASEVEFRIKSEAIRERFRVQGRTSQVDVTKFQRWKKGNVKVLVWLVQ
jgi:hypothetical protein